jgi:NAD+ diphosphatase
VEINFCRRCASRLTPKGNGAYKCENGHHVYYKPYPAAGVLLVNSRDEVLLAVRGIEPNKGSLDTPGGFTDPGETHLQTAERELREELGLTPDDYEPLQYLSEAIDHYPYEGEDTINLHVVYWARIKRDDKQIKPTDDVADIVWVPLTDIDFDKISKDATSDRLALKTLQQQFGVAGD